MTRVSREALDQMTAITVAANRQAMGKSEFEARLIAAQAGEASYMVAYRDMAAQTRPPFWRPWGSKK